jgi:hypothetical protein
MESVNKEKLNHEKGTAKGRHLKVVDICPHTKESPNSFINLYKTWSNSEKANEWRSKLAQIEDF